MYLPPKIQSPWIWKNQKYLTQHILDCREIDFDGYTTNLNELKHVIHLNTIY